MVTREYMYMTVYYFHKYLIFKKISLVVFSLSLCDNLFKYANNLNKN